MQKKFVTNLALLLLLNLLIKPFWILGIEREVQNRLGDGEYGVYFALLNFSFLLNILLDVGITNFNNKNIAQNNHLLTKHFSSLFVLKLVLALVYIIVTLLIGLIIGYDFRYMKLLMVLGFNQFLISMVLYLRSNLLGLHLFKTDSIISVLDRLIMIIICAVLLWGHVFDVEMDIMLFVYIQTFAYALTALIAFLVVVQRAEFLRLRWSLPFSLMILKKSFPFAILVLLMTFYNRIDAVMLERMLPEKLTLREGQNISGAWQAGIYAKGYRLLDAANMIAYLFAVQLLPIFSRMLKYKESVEQLVKLAFTLIITPAIVVAAACYFFQDQLMDLLYTPKIPAEWNFGIMKIGYGVLVEAHKEVSANVFGTLMMCFIPISTTYIFGTLLTANGNLRELNIMAGTGMLINIGLNIFFIPHFYALGSAFASLTTQVLTAITQIIMAQYVFKFRINYRLLTILFIFISGVVLIGLLCTRLHFPVPGEPGKERWFINFAIMVAGCGLWAFISRQISIKAMFRILKYG
jgi:O-antigen/teichoic acid export membrane protein